MLSVPLWRPPALLNRLAGCRAASRYAPRRVGARVYAEPHSARVLRPSRVMAPEHREPINVPPAAHSVLSPSNPIVPALAQPAIVVERQLEMMNVMLGFEQANRYQVTGPGGETLCYMAEGGENSLGRMLGRQLLRTHRQFSMHVFDTSGAEVLRIRRPFQLVNSKIFIYDVSGGQDELLIGQVQQRWHPWRRRYDLFTFDGRDELVQFSYIDEPLLSWDFTLRDQDNAVMGSVNRNFSGFAREIFTDTGNYVLRMDAASHLAAANPSATALAPHTQGLTLDQRAVMLACAVSIDFDYFSKLSHAGAGGGWFPMPFIFPFGGGGGGGEAAAEADEPGQEARQGGEVAGAGDDEPAEATEERPWWDAGGPAGADEDGFFDDDGGYGGGGGGDGDGWL